MLHLSKDSDKIVELIQLFQETNDVKYRTKIMEECWNSLQKFARYFYNIYRFYSIEDYEYYMLEALITVIEKYDTTRNNKFVTYFYYRARGTVLDKLKVDLPRQRKVKFLSIDKEYLYKGETSFTMHDLIADCRYDGEAQLISKETYNETFGQDEERYKKILKRLPDGRVKDVFYQYYIQKRKLSTISKDLGITENAVSSLLYYVKKQFLPHHVRSYKMARCNLKHSYDDLIQFARNQLEKDLLDLYFIRKLPMQEVTNRLGFSIHSGYYYLRKIKERYRKNKQNNYV